MKGLNGLYEMGAAERAMLKKHGIEVKPMTLPHGGWTELGTAKHGDSAITISVSAMPARFYRFAITPSEPGVKPVTFETGSGSLFDFMPTARLMAEGMIVIKEA